MPTEPRDRFAVLSRCIATDPQTFATEYWGRRPLLSPSSALPRDFSDLLSPDTVDELIAERGVRAPFIRLAKEGDVLARDCYLGPAGFGAEMPDQVDSAKVLDPVRLWRNDCAARAAPAVAAADRLRPAGGRRIWAILCRRTPTSRRPPTAASIRITTSTTCSSCKRPDRSAGSCTSPCTTIPCRPSRGHDIGPRSPSASPANPVIDTVLSAGDALYLPRGWVHSAQALDTTSIHLTIGVSAVTGRRRRSRGRRSVGDRRRVPEVAADGQRPDRSG